MVTAPTLKELKERPCTLEELQAAVVKLVELHNGMDSGLKKMVTQGRIRSSHEAMMNKPYGL